MGLIDTQHSVVVAGPNTYDRKVREIKRVSTGDPLTVKQHVAVTLAKLPFYGSFRSPKASTRMVFGYNADGEIVLLTYTKEKK